MMQRICSGRKVCASLCYFTATEERKTERAGRGGGEDVVQALAPTLVLTDHQLEFATAS
jgi:hypothetical protein